MFEEVLRDGTTDDRGRSDVFLCSFFLCVVLFSASADGSQMNPGYSSWKSRGWCQFELAVNGLLGISTDGERPPDDYW